MGFTSTISRTSTNPAPAQQYLGTRPDKSDNSRGEAPVRQYTPGRSECLTLPNAQYSSINMRGSMGSSSYNALNLKFQTQNLHNTGLSMVANWTWSHALDDISSTFSDSLQGGSGYIGSLGYTDPFNPKLDWGPADYDVRHRLVISPIWETPWFKSGKSIAAQALGGWSAVGVFTARTGVPFTAYDQTNDDIGYTVPRLSRPRSQIFMSAPILSLMGRTLSLALQSRRRRRVLSTRCLVFRTWDRSRDMSGRNAFRGPDAWNLDSVVAKKFKSPNA